MFSLLMFMLFWSNLPDVMEIQTEEKDQKMLLDSWENLYGKIDKTV